VGTNFGYSVSVSGSIGLVGTGFSGDAAYVFRNLDTATGNVTENVKITASDGVAGDFFGTSVSLDGDNFLIGAYGADSARGKAYTGSVSSMTTLDAGNASRTIDRISFISKDDWIVGQTTDSNQVTLTAGDAGNVTASGKAVFIGKNAGSDNNTLIVEGTLTATEIVIGTSENSGNTLRVGTGGTSGSVSGDIVNNGSVVFNRSDTASHGGTISGTGSVTKEANGTWTLSGNNSYSGGTFVNAGTLIAGHTNAVGTGSVTVTSGSFIIESGVTLSNTIILVGGTFERAIAASASLANTVNATSTLSGGRQTQARILGGTASGASTLDASFAAASGAENDGIRLSDVFHLSGVKVVDILSGQTDTFVLQLQIVDVNADSFLGWLDENNTWVNAVDGNIEGFANFAGNRAYDPLSDLVLGRYGVDTANNTVWAVINHNSEFGVIPEPSTAALLLIGGAASFLISRRRSAVARAPIP